MMRPILLYFSTASWARRFVTGFPLARKVARRFIAGESLTNAINLIEQLNANKILVTLDYLGESVEKASDTDAVVATYTQALTTIIDQQLQAGVSLKLTHLGLDIDRTLCVNNLTRILELAHPHHIPVTIDMESSDYTQVTLEIFRQLREAGFTNLGTVIQAYLYRSQADMQQLSEEAARVRICKGAYLESETIAFPQKTDVDANYLKLIETYFTASPDSYLAIATHDEKMIVGAKQIIETLNIPASRYEFQMLYGIRAQLQQSLVDEGFKVRIYVPFGETWYPYFMRRLAERPANLWFFIKSLFSS